MTDELKPCPFCGGKPHRGPGIYISCSNDDCPCICEAWGDNEDKAKEAWNRRAYEIIEGNGTGDALPEIRTCKNTWDVNLTGRLRFQCSECRSVSLEITPNFCPACGAKVVEQ